MMRETSWIRIFPVPIILVFILLDCVPLEAANLKAEPSLTLEETWDSNIFSSATDETSDYIFRARPALTLSIEAFHTTAKITGGFEFERYADNSELNETAATNNFDLSVAEPFQITPRFFLKPSVTYVETRDSGRRNELTQDPTLELPAADTVVTARSKQRTYRAFLQMTYLLTPNVSFSLGGGGARREFVETVPETEEEDSQTITGDASVSYRFTPRFSSGLFFTANYHSFDVSPDAKSYSGGIDGKYLLSPNNTVAWRVGASYFEEDADATGQTTEEWSPYGKFTLTHTWKTFRVTLGGSYEVSGVGPFGQATERRSVSLTVANQFSERWWGDLSGSYQINESIGDQDTTVDIATINGSAGIRYTATKWASFHLKGNVVRQRSDGIEGNDIDRESVTFGIVLSKPYEFGGPY